MIKGIISSILIISATIIAVFAALILHRPVKQYAIYEIMSDR